jgi:tetratricopeptide (TPR) repeat protein
MTGGIPGKYATTALARSSGVTPHYYSPVQILASPTFVYCEDVGFSFQERQLIRAATGWLELGDALSAFEELERLPAKTRTHPNVLKIRYEIYAKAGKWELAFELAEGLSRLLPNEVTPFIWRSCSARRVADGGIEWALELLLDVVNDFPDEPIVPFNLACYSCQLGKLVEARSWLHITWEVAAKDNSARAWKLRAIDEKDLEPLWKELRGLK